MPEMKVTESGIQYQDLWSNIEQAIRSLNNDFSSDYNLDLISHKGKILSHMLVSGGKDSRVVLYYVENPSNPSPRYMLLDPSQTETIEIMAGGALMPVDKPELAVSVEVALEALKFYYDTQRFPAHLNWEKLEW